MTSLRYRSVVIQGRCLSGNRRIRPRSPRRAAITANDRLGGLRARPATVQPGHGRKSQVDVHLDLSGDELLATTRAVRRRLDFDRPIEREVLLQCVDLATQAPSGSNSQRWHWVFVADPAKKIALAEIYYRAFKLAYSPDAVRQSDDAGTRVWSSAQYLAEHLHEVPFILVPCQWGRPPADSSNQAGYWGSLLPAAWSFCLAARNRGLGTAWTTMHLRHEEEAAGILGVPYESCAQGGLFPIAYTKGTSFRRAPRADAGDVVHWNSW